MAQGPADAAPRPWRDLGVRAASAVIMAPLGFASLWYGGDLLLVVMACLCAAAVFEWIGMMRAGTPGRWPVPVLLIGGCYILPAPVLVAWMRAAPEVGRANVLFLVLIVWGSDIGAYLVGRLVGGPKLAPRISPGKTRSGAVGGLAVAMLIGWGAAVAWNLSPAQGIVVAALLGIASQIGDLFESAAKRHFGVKDSGRLIPGHGGVLDRIDGLLVAAPAAAVLVLMLGQGKVLWQ